MPIGLAAIPLVLRRIEESYGGDAGLDIPGLALISASGFAIVWGLVRGNSAGWGSLEIVGALAAGLLLAVAFVAWELRAKEPMVPMRFFRSRAFSAGNASIFFTLASLFGAVFFFAQMLQTALGYGPLDAGLRLIPWTVTFITVAPLVGSLVDRVGERPFMVAGLSLQALGLGWIALIADSGLTYSEFLVPSIVAGVGVSMAIPSAQNSVVGSFSVRGRRQGRRRQQHDARARRRVRYRGRGGGVLRRRQLRLTGRLPRRVRARGRRPRGVLAGRRDRRPCAPGSPARGRIRPDRSGSGPRGRGRELITMRDAMRPLRSNSVVHLELHTGDLPQARDVYAELCGWHPEWIEAQAGSYLSLELGAGLGGGIVECGVRSPRWLPYVEVSEIAEATDRARKLGASVLLEPRECPAGWRSVVATRSGGEIAFWQAKAWRPSQPGSA